MAFLLRKCLYIAFIIVSLLKTEYSIHNLLFSIWIKAALLNDDSSVLCVDFDKSVPRRFWSLLNSKCSTIILNHVVWVHSSRCQLHSILSPKPLVPPSHSRSKVKSQIHIYHLPIPSICSHQFCLPAYYSKWTTCILIPRETLLVCSIGAH